MHALDALGEPVRRRIMELLADGERAAGEVSAVVQEEFGISQPEVSQHLRVLRENGFTTLQGFRRFWAPHLDALATEIARGKRGRRAEDGAADAGDREGREDA